MATDKVKIPVVKVNRPRVSPPRTVVVPKPRTQVTKPIVRPVKATPTRVVEAVVPQRTFRRPGEKRRTVPDAALAVKDPGMYITVNTRKTKTKNKAKTMLIEEDPDELYETVVLREHQTDHYERVKNIIQGQAGYIDLSEPGLGKTRIVGALAQEYDFTLGIVSTATVCDEVWKPFCKTHGIPAQFIISYGELRSNWGCQPKHGMLDRIDTLTEKRRKVTAFSATQKYQDIVNHGILLVFDEIQHIKNNSSQYKACAELVSKIINTGGTSRFAMLSGSPYCDYHNAVNMCKALGYIRSPKMYVSRGGVIELQGLQEMIDVCRNIDRCQTDATLAEFEICKSNINEVTHTLFVRIIKGNIASEMPRPANIPYRKHVYAGFYDMDARAEADVAAAVRELAIDANFDMTNGTIDRKKAMGSVGKLIKASNIAKIPVYTRLARKWLEDDVNTRVTIILHNPDVIDELEKLLDEFNPIKVTGAVNRKHRPSLFEQFRTSDTSRLLLANNTVIAEGISLHDTVGNRPNKVLISPDYDLIKTHQITQRFYRVGIMSDVEVYQVYSKGVEVERSIMDAIARKAPILKDLVQQQVNDGIVFPGEYTVYNE